MSRDDSRLQFRRCRAVSDQTLALSWGNAWSVRKHAARRYRLAPHAQPLVAIPETSLRRQGLVSGSERGWVLSRCRFALFRLSALVGGRGANASIRAGGELGR